MNPMTDDRLATLRDVKRIETFKNGSMVVSLV